MPKKASAVTPPQDVRHLTALARGLPEPSDFYRGRRRRDDPLPDNILIFHRQRAAELNPAKETKAFHQRHVLIVPLRGDGRVIANAQTIPATPGRCVLIAPFQFHHYTALSQPNIDWLFITYTYAPGSLSDNETGLFTPGPTFWTDLTTLIRAYSAEDATAHTKSLSLRLALLLNDLSATSATRSPHVLPVAEEKLLLEVSAVAAAHLSTPLSIHQVAATLGVSPSHLRQKFQHVSGISLGRFLREFRLRNAAELLATGQANVTEASLACGFETPYAFSRAFRRYWGRPPKVFALAHRRQSHVTPAKAG